MSIKTLLLNRLQFQILLFKDHVHRRVYTFTNFRRRTKPYLLSLLFSFLLMTGKIISKFKISNKFKCSGFNLFENIVGKTTSLHFIFCNKSDLTCDNERFNESK